MPRRKKQETPEVQETPEMQETPEVQEASEPVKNKNGFVIGEQVEFGDILKHQKKLRAVQNKQDGK